MWISFQDLGAEHRGPRVLPGKGEFEPRTVHRYAAVSLAATVLITERLINYRHN